MDFTWTPDQKAFRAQIRAVLDRELPQDWAEKSAFDTGSSFTNSFARQFCPKLAEEGLMIPHWPREHGGRGPDPWLHWILNEEMWSVGEPRSYQYMSVNWVGPSIIHFGTPEQKEQFLPRIAGGTVFFCQGFSEPNAGSDLAALKTRATRTDKGFVINGQKIWTSNAGHADLCILLARTGAAEGKEISVLIVPMNLPGITVRNIAGNQGQEAFNEVFFDDVEVPYSALLGEEHRGWTVVRQILSNERVGAPRYALTRHGFRRAVDQLRRNGGWSDGIAARAARCEAALLAAQIQAYRVVDGRVKGRPADAETNMTRYASVLADRMVSEFLGDFCPELAFYSIDPVVAAAYKRGASSGIAVGAAELQLNLIARKHLGLPTS